MRSQTVAEDGGSIIAQVLASYGIQQLFTLCGGHISPILVGCKRRGLQVVDVRDEASAVFAADAVARMTGVPGVAAVTAGPGVTNVVTAVKNAQLAQSPVLVLGGATGTLLKGRGALQDIDQMAIMRPLTKFASTVKRLSNLGPTVAKALDIAMSGVPGPVFVEVPVDLLYPEKIVRDLYLKESGVLKARNLGARALGLFIRGHLYRQFHQPRLRIELPTGNVKRPWKRDKHDQISQVAALLRGAKRPAIVIGSQSMLNCTVVDADAIARAVRSIGAPTWLGGSARGLLGRRSEIQFRHNRGAALKEADVVVVCGFPFDFRMSYGRAIGRRATVVSANLSNSELRKNLRPDVAVKMNAGDFLRELAQHMEGPTDSWSEWFDTLRKRETARDEEITAQAATQGELINPVHFFMRLEEKLSDDAVIVADGGDFVATASYIVRPRAPLRWLDPGVFGTLGVGGGFAIGASSVHPKAEIWLIYGDGSCGYSMAEFDTYVRHGMAPIAVIGSDGAWAQIAREQVEMLGDDVGTVLNRAPYHVVAEGYGGVGLLLTQRDKIDETLDEAKAIAKSGRPVCINVHIAASDFRKGSISM